MRSNSSINILGGSDWNFMEQQFFIERLLQKKFVRFFNVIYTGDKLAIEPKIQIHTTFNEPIFA
jgi:hypothetical protein